MKLLKMLPRGSLGWGVLLYWEVELQVGWLPVRLCTVIHIQSDNLSSLLLA